MDFIANIIHIFANLDDYIAYIVDLWGWGAYAIMFLLIFMETGIVIIAFVLPGESLVFASAAFAAATGKLEPLILMPMFMIAAIAGDSLNYEIGKALGRKLLALPKRRIIKDSAISKTKGYFDKYGGKTVVIARFIPTVRTFTPFFAGMTRMRYPWFLRNNILGAMLWVCVIFPLGYFFGTIPFVANNFSTVILAVVALALVPALTLLIKNKLASRNAAKPAKEIR